MYIQQTVQWIQSVVIDHNLCPFAKREMDNNAVRIEVSSATEYTNGMKDFLNDIEYLNANPATGTSLLLFPHCGSDFFEYLDFVDLAQEMLVKTGHEGIYQIATFHPKYEFEGIPRDDVTNYTNRSPYPMLHLLREEMLDKAIAYYGNTDMIPENNMRRMQELGLLEVQRLFKNCLK
jgi:uncharacterized protein